MTPKMFLMDTLAILYNSIEDGDGKDTYMNELMDQDECELQSALNDAWPDFTANQRKLVGCAVGCVNYVSLETIQMLFDHPASTIGDRLHLMNGLLCTATAENSNKAFPILKSMLNRMCVCSPTPNEQHELDRISKGAQYLIAEYEKTDEKRA